MHARGYFWVILKNRTEKLVRFRNSHDVCQTILFKQTHIENMPKIDTDTKEKILAAAEKVFHANGFKGTRTTLIAEEAGISRTMLHYHYSTKEALFQEVLNKTLSTVFSYMSRLLTEDKNLEELIAHLVDIIADVLEEKPGLPSFLVNILNENPDISLFLAASQNDTIPKQLDELLKMSRQNGEIATNMTGEDLIMNIYALCSMPYLGMPYIKAKEKRDDEGMKVFIRERRGAIKAFILRGVKN
jgi:TetR/AcrR family transcriptional regulator